MKRGTLNIIVLCSVAALGIGAVVVWLAWSVESGVQERIPVEHKPLFKTRQSTQLQNTGTLIAGPGKPSDDAGSWPQFRGADRTNIVLDAPTLARNWPPEGPPTLWKVEVGEGYAGAAIHNGRVYLVDYDRERQEDAVRCLSLEDGAEIWRYTYSVKIKRSHGMTRTVPAVNDDYLVAIGPKCHVHCLSATSGQLVWKIDMVKEFGTTVPPWYAGQCPLVEGDAAILAPGGDPLMMAVELATGRVLWRTPNPGGWGMTHSSIVAMDYEGSRQYIYCTTQGVVGVSASDGRILWTKPDWKIAMANVPTPVVVGGDRVFLSGGYNSGCVMIRLKGEGDTVSVEEVFRLKHTVFGADQQTAILWKEHIYGVIPGGELACLALDGSRLWTSGKANRFGLGPFLLADGLLFVLDDQQGELHVVEATPGRYAELARAKVVDGHEPWGPMAMASGRLILRDFTHLVCLEVPR